MKLRVGIVVVELGACSPSGEPAATVERAPTVAVANEPVAERVAFTIGKPVVACSSGGEFVVAKDGAKLRIWSARGREIAAVDALVAEDDRPWARYAVSSDGAWLAEADEQRVRVTAVAGGKRWSKAGLLHRLWGDPVFSPDSKLIALPRTGSVAVVEAATGNEVEVIGARDNFVFDKKYGIPYKPAEGISLARRIYFSADGRRIAVTCESNTESRSNHSVFVGEIASGDVIAELPGHSGPAHGVAFLSDGRVLTVDGGGILRWFDVDGRVHAELEAMAFEGEVAVGPADRFVVVHGHSSLALWDRQSGKMRHAGLDTACANVDEEGTVWSVTRGGAVAKPDLVDRPGTLQPREIDADHREARRAVWAIALGGTRWAADALEKAPKEPSYAAASRLARFKLAGTDDFAGYLREAGADDLVLSGLPVLGQEYAEGGELDLALQLLSAWLVFRRGRPSAEQAIALDLGGALVRGLDSPHDLELAKLLRATWPDEAVAIATYADALASEEPNAVRKALQRFVARNPKSAEGWAALGELHELADRRDEALAAYDRALELDPDNEDVKFRRERVASPASK